MSQPELELQIADSPRPAISAAELWSTAVHEAGHAVVAVYYQIPFTTVSIEPNGNGAFILDRKKDKTLKESPDRIRYASKLIVTGYSGFIGQYRVAPSTPRSDVQYDEEHIGDLLWDTTPYERIYDSSTGSFRPPTKAEAEQIVNRRARRLWRITRHLVRRLFPVIQHVARALIEHKQLTGDEVAAIAGPMIADTGVTLSRPAAP